MLTYKVKLRVTIRPAFSGLVPLFSSKIPLFASVKQNGLIKGVQTSVLIKPDPLNNKKKGVISKKQKKKSTPVWSQDFCSLRLENDTKRVSKELMTFFFFGDHPSFLIF